MMEAEKANLLEMTGENHTTGGAEEHQPVNI